MNKAQQKNRNRFTDTENALKLARWERGRGMGKKGAGNKKYKSVVTEEPRGCKVRQSEYGSQRTYTHDP